MKRRVYADHAATTPVRPEVLSAMLPYFSEQYGNPSSLHGQGRSAATAVMKARKQVAAAIGAKDSEIFFTSGGSESDTWAIRCVAYPLTLTGKRHLVTTAMEHHAVLHPCRTLEVEGFDVTYVGVRPDGIVHPEDVTAAIREDTALVSVMYANNEIGTLQPVMEIGAICRERNVLFHTDAVQALGNVPIDVAAQNIDLLSLSGHKIHAPKGIGALYIREGVPITPLIEGGGQETGRRSGTENVPGIVGLGIAAEIACRDIPERSRKIAAMRDRLIDGLLALPGARLNGHREYRLCGNVNISFWGVDSEKLLLILDMHGISASSGSACSSGSLTASHVLTSIGLEHNMARRALRLSLGEDNTREDVDYLLEIIPGAVRRLRDQA